MFYYIDDSAVVYKQGFCRKIQISIIQIHPKRISSYVFFVLTNNQSCINVMFCQTIRSFYYTIQYRYLISKDETYVRHFKLDGTNIVFKFTKPPRGTSEFDWIRKCLNQIFETSKTNVAPTDYLRFKLLSINLKSAEPWYVALRPASLRVFI